MDGVTFADIVLHNASCCAVCPKGGYGCGENAGFVLAGAQDPQLALRGLVLRNISVTGGDGAARPWVCSAKGSLIGTAEKVTPPLPPGCLTPPAATPPATAKTDDDAADTRSAAAASWLVLPPCVAGGCTAYSFDQAKYHVVNSGDDAHFPKKDVHIVNGTLSPGGGDLRLHSANGTFPDTMIRFGPAENISKYLTHTRNMSTSLAGKRFHGRAVFIDSPKAMDHELEQMLWYTPPPIAPGSNPIVGEVIIGPNPAKTDDDTADTGSAAGTAATASTTVVINNVVPRRDTAGKILNAHGPVFPSFFCDLQ